MTVTTSVIIPSRNEPYLAKTVEEVFAKAAGAVDCYVICDGYWPTPALPDRDDLIVLHFGESKGMRRCINAAAAIAKGEFLMKLDAHCLLGGGYDEALVKACDGDTVVIPRRHRLDPENWRVDDLGKLPVDYQYLIYPRKFRPPSLRGFRWDERSLAHKDLDVDETLTFQGSSWFMKKSHFQRHHFMQIDGYLGLPQQEAEEIALTTWLNGGRVLVAKTAWYAHLHKIKDRFYPWSNHERQACYDYSYRHWVKDHWDGFEKLIEHFMPIPGWPTNWRERIHG